MSSDKRRRARVQGGWAPPTNARSDRDKPKVQTTPNWYGKTVDQPSPKKFVYEPPTEEVRQKPPDKVISLIGPLTVELAALEHLKYPYRFTMSLRKPGVYDISTEPSGLSRLRLFPAFLDPKEADWMFTELHQELPWRQRSDVKNGEEYLQPRLTAWFGDHSYSYAGVTHDATKEWTPALKQIKDHLEEVTGCQFNSVLANLYRDGHDHVPWHSDDETSLGPEPTIASLSFGDPRTFQLRKKPPPEENGDYTYMQQIEVPLTHGSLLIMEGASQADWQHRIPREYHDRSARINLTFRVIYPE